MIVSQLKRRRLKQREPGLSVRLPLATGVMLGIVFLLSAIAVAWFAGEPQTSQFFAHLNLLQRHPPFWLNAPTAPGSHLIVPTAILVLLTLVIARLSPQPRTWSRLLVVAILLALTLRYVLWRMCSTLNLSDPLNGVFSLGLLIVEMLLLVGGTIQLFLLLRSRDRSHQADQMAVAVRNGSFLPSVDVLIPTYNEPDFILRRTIVGCQAMDYTNKTIYLLDDTRRPEIRALAQELGCQYITRPDNRHAKAGNLNHALPKTNSELIVIFDADFVPTRNFLSRTVGFFQQERVALVQTPQSFYNDDPVARNLGLEHLLNADEEMFYRHLQPMRDGVGSVICAGTSFVVRRSALEAVGGFETDSISEDYFTGIRLSAQGDQLIYLNEKLSAGLSADNIAAFTSQRLRWCRGTLQAFFIEANPLTIPGLTLTQRLSHLEGLIHWFTTLSRVFFLFMPLAYAFLGVIPVRTTPAELLYFFLPYYLVQMTAFSWLTRRCRSALFSEIYYLVTLFPVALTVLQVMLKPFAKGFKVTPKGVTGNRFSFNWKLAWPLMLLFAAIALSFWCNLGFCIISLEWHPMVPPELDATRGVALGWLWSSYSAIMLGIALLALVDAPRPSVYDWFSLHKTIRLKVGDQKEWGTTTALSEIGAQIVMNSKFAIPTNLHQSVRIELAEEQLCLQGQVTQVDRTNSKLKLRIVFEAISPKQHRRLIELLYCRPGQWLIHNAPGELRSLWLLLRVLLRPPALNRNRPFRIIPVAPTAAEP